MIEFIADCYTYGIYSVVIFLCSMVAWIVVGWPFVELNLQFLWFPVMLIIVVAVGSFMFTVFSWLGWAGGWLILLSLPA